MSHHLNKDRAIVGTLLSTSPSLLLCAGTTAIGLYAFIPTDYQGVSELGLLAGTSLFICLTVTLFILPVMLKIIPVNITTSLVAGKYSRIEHLPETLASLTLHYAKPIAIAVGVLAVISVALLPQVRNRFLSDQSA